jgi:hypothetical protein
MSHKELLDIREAKTSVLKVQLDAGDDKNKVINVERGGHLWKCRQASLAAAFLGVFSYIFDEEWKVRATTKCKGVKWPGQNMKEDCPDEVVFKVEGDNGAPNATAKLTADKIGKMWQFIAAFSDGATPDFAEGVKNIVMMVIALTSPQTHQVLWKKDVLCNGADITITIPDMLLAANIEDAKEKLYADVALNWLGQKW